MIRLLAAEPSVTSITLYDTTRGREAVSVRATRVLRAAAGTEAGRRVAGALRLRRLAAARRRAAACARRVASASPGADCRARVCTQSAREERAAVRGGPVRRSGRWRAAAALAVFALRAAGAEAAVRAARVLAARAFAAALGA